MLTGSDSAPAKAREAADKNEIGTAKDSATLLVTEYTQEFYDKKYVKNDVSMKNVASAGDYIKSKLSSEVTRDGYKIQTVSNSGNEQESQTGIWVDGTKVSEMSLSQLLTKLKNGFEQFYIPAVDLEEEEIDPDFVTTSGIKVAQNIEGPYAYEWNRQGVIMLPVGNNYAYALYIHIETDAETGDSYQYEGIFNSNHTLINTETVFGSRNINGDVTAENNHNIVSKLAGTTETVSDIISNFESYFLGESDCESIYFILGDTGDAIYLNSSCILPASGSSSNSKIQISKGDTVLATGTISSNGVITWDNN